MAKVSVVIPIYNVEKYLPTCLDSVIAQTLKDIEIILVDDGSKDKSGEICDEYAKKDSRITVIHQENQYVGIARNNGMDAAKGEYIIFLDSDDYFVPEMLEELVKRAEAYDADMTICKERAFFDKEQEFGSMDWAQSVQWIPNKEVFSGDDIPDYIANICVLWPWDKLYKLSFLRENDIRFPLDRTVAASEDLVFGAHTLAVAKKITFLRKVLVTHRYHSKSLEATRNARAASLSVMMFGDRLKKLGLFEKYERSFINLAIGHITWSLSVTKKENYKKELKYAKETFKLYNFDKYKKEYFHVPKEYEIYLKKKNCFSALAVYTKNIIKHTNTIIQSLSI